MGPDKNILEQGSIVSAFLQVLPRISPPFLTSSISHWAGKKLLVLLQAAHIARSILSSMVGLEQRKWEMFSPLMSVSLTEHLS